MLSKEELIVLRHYVNEGLTKTATAETLGVCRRYIPIWLAYTII